jgi:hypothetical protein
MHYQSEVNIARIMDSSWPGHPGPREAQPECRLRGHDELIIRGMLAGSLDQ